MTLPVTVMRWTSLRGKITARDGRAARDIPRSSRR